MVELKLTDRYRRVVDDQTHFRPLPQWVKIYSSVDQRLNMKNYRSMTLQCEVAVLNQNQCQFFLV